MNSVLVAGRGSGSVGWFGLDVFEDELILVDRFAILENEDWYFFGEDCTAGSGWCCPKGLP